MQSIYTSLNLPYFPDCSSNLSLFYWHLLQNHIYSAYTHEVEGSKTLKYHPHCETWCWQYHVVGESLLGCAKTTITFQWENNPKDAARAAIKIFISNYIDVLEWPKINLSENLWQELKIDVYMPSIQCGWACLGSQKEREKNVRLPGCVISPAMRNSGRSERWSYKHNHIFQTFCCKKNLRIISCFLRYLVLDYRIMGFL